MGTIAHAELNRVHQIWDTRLIFATYSDLKNNVGSKLTADTVGLIARVTADGSLWEHVQFTPCIQIKLIAGKDVSRAEETIYVDWATGNDTTGNGSINFKYKSHRFLDNLQKVTEGHDYRIKAAANQNYDYFPKDFCPYTAGGGRIIFDSSDETFPVYAGPFTVTAVTNVGPSDAHYFTAHATDLTVAGAGWTVDDFYGKSIRMLSGNWAGYVLYLHKNTADTITTIADWWGFSIGDEFEIVTEPVVITVDYPITIRGNSTMHKYTASTTPDTPFDPSLLFCGYRFKSSALNPFRLEDINAIFSACTFWGEETDLTSVVLNLSRFSINFDDIPAGSFAVSTFEDFYAFASQSIPLNGNASQPAALTCVQVFGPGYLSQMSMRGELRSEKALGHFQTFGCHVGKGTFIDSGTGSHEYMFVEQIGYDTPGFVVDNTKGVSIVSAYIRHHEGGLFTKHSNIYIAWLKGEDPLAGSYGADIGAGSIVTIPNSANVTLTGPLGAIIIKYPNNDVFANWPGAGVTFTNSVFTSHVIGDNTI